MKKKKMWVLDVYFYSKYNVSSFAKVAQELGVLQEDIDIRTMDQIQRVMVTTNHKTMLKLKRKLKNYSTRSIDVRR